MPTAAPQEAPDRDRHPCRGDVPDRAERAVGARLPVRHHRRWPHPEDAERDRRVHPRMPWPSKSTAPSTPTMSSPSSTASPLERGGAPVFVRFDNGPEFVAHAVADWCRFNGTDTCSSTPARPGRTPGSSRSTAGSATSCSTAGNSTPPRSPSDHRGLAHRLQLNRPHTAHGDLTPTEFAPQLDHDQPTPSRIAPGPLIGSLSTASDPSWIRQ